MNSTGDCYSGNPNPDWHYYGFGHPQLVNNSTDGNAPEEIYHPDPGDGQYKLVVYFQEPVQDCGTHQECTYVERDCSNCGCRCWSIFCIFGSLCCNDCNVCTDVYGCEFRNAQVIVRFYVNDALVPSRTELIDLEPTDINQHPQAELTINRAGGRFYFY